MFGFSGEHLLVLLVILLIFGPKRLPDLGHSLGRTLKNFKDAMGGGSQNEGVPPAQQIPPASTPTPNATQEQASSAKAPENAPIQPKG